MLLRLCAAMAVLTLLACERPSAESAAPSTDAAGGRVFPELADVARVVAEARAILPRIPADVAPAPLAHGTLPATPEPRLALVGEGRLLRPGTFPGLSPRLLLEVWLDDRTPPGGKLRVTDGRGTTTWPILDAHAAGRRDGAFSYTFRVADDAARLRYLAVLGVPYVTGEKHFRALEGYLLLPTSGGVSITGPLYALDFGYRHAEPPEPMRDARDLSERIGDLRTRREALATLQTRLAELQRADTRLREAAVPAEQATRRREDLADFARRSDALRGEQAQVVAALRSGLLAVYRQRVALAAAWTEFSEGNAYRWRTPAERRAAYLPLQTLRAAYPELERVYEALGGSGDPELRDARQAMEQAVLREQERAPLKE